jgi:opacity protein-like surface antigen
MKTILTRSALAICAAFTFSSAIAENPVSPVKSEATHHEGFYAALGIGPSFGHIHDEYNGSGEYSSLSYSGKWDGTGVAFDLRLGGSVIPDLIITGDITSRAITSPTFKSENISGTTDNSISISEVTYGVGVTRFFMPYDFYVGATVGAGAFVLQHNEGGDFENSTSVRSDFGFSGILRAGKSWRLGRNWSIGAGLGYGITNTSTSDNTGKEDMRSSRMFAMVTCSFH